MFPNKNLPKALVDRNGGFRMVMTDASAYPTVDVYASSSADGLIWTPPAPVVHEAGVSHWDPMIAQRPNGRYYLYSAPDDEEGLGRQRIALTTSNDFVHWSATRTIAPGEKGGTKYWNYWPEGFVSGNQIILFYNVRAWHRPRSGRYRPHLDDARPGRRSRLTAVRPDRVGLSADSADSKPARSAGSTTAALRACGGRPCAG